MKEEKFYSPKGTVYHIYKDCHVGNNIEKGSEQAGTAGRRLCEVCRKRREAEKKKSKK